MADTTIYIGDVGLDITVDCGQDISTATQTRLQVQTPLGLVRFWPATLVTIDGQPNYLQYTTALGDLDEAGVYAIQPNLRLGGWSGSGKTVNLTVLARFA